MDTERAFDSQALSTKRGGQVEKRGDDHMPKSIKDRIKSIPADAYESLTYIIAAIIIICILIGFIILQLILAGQLFGVLLGLITFTALIATLYAYFKVERSEENPSLALKLRVIVTIIFLVFLIEAIITVVAFYSPIIQPFLIQLFSNVGLEHNYPGASLITIGILVVIVIIFLSIPVCLWTGICRSLATSAAPAGHTSQAALLAKKLEETPFPKKCPTCGTSLSGSEEFCSNCGEPI